jgi:hypothetical protein
MKSLLRPLCLSVCLVASSLVLAGCQKEKKSGEARTAQGEILPGSASDAMLPLDSVRSQPPLAPEEQASGKPGKSGSSGKSAAAKEPGATEAAGPPSPGVSPSVAPEPAAAE